MIGRMKKGFVKAAPKDLNSSRRFFLFFHRKHPKGQKKECFDFEISGIGPKHVNTKSTVDFSKSCELIKLSS